MTLSKNRKSANALLSLMLSYCSALALCMRFERPDIEEFGLYGSRLINLLENLHLSLEGSLFVSCLVFAAVFALSLHNRRQKRRPCVLMSVFSLLIAGVWLFGKSFSVDNTTASIYSTADQLIKSLIFLFGSWWILVQVFMLSEALMESDIDLPFSDCALLRFYRKHCFLSVFLPVFLSELIVALIFYPGEVTPDAWVQLAFYADLTPFSSHAPPVHTIWMGVCVSLGSKLGSPDFGVFLIVLQQILASALVFSYMLLTMGRLNAPRYLRLVTFFIILFCPLFCFPPIILEKDVPYSHFFLLFICELVNMRIIGKDYFRSKLHILLFALSVLGVYLFRNNGKYVLFPTVLLSAVLLCTRPVNRTRRGYRPRVLLVLLLPLLLSAAAQGLTEKLFVEVKGSVAEVLSLPFQQTARTVKYCAEDISAEEAEAIDKILDYDTLAEKYNPLISDPIKKVKGSTAELLDYLRVWFAMGLRHPAVYIDSVLNQNYFLLYPFDPEPTLLFSEPASKHTWVTDYYLMSDFGGSTAATELIRSYERCFNSMPVFGMLNLLSFYITAFLFLCVYAIKKKLPDFFPVAFPLLLSVLVVILAPVIHGHSRYAYPIIYSLPLLAAYTLFLVRKNTGVNENVR